MKLGVLGGIGPEATGLFYNKLITELQSRNLVKENKDFPQIFINSIPAPELINGTATDEELSYYINGLKELDSLNLDYIVMVCNTIHLYIDDLQKEIKTPIINLRDEMKNYLFENNISKVTVLGTHSTIKQGLYKFDELLHQDPSDNEIDSLKDNIFEFNLGNDKPEQIKSVESIAKKYLEKGSEFIILACTEFGVMLENSNIPKISSIDILVESVIKKLTK
jgi:aspartate racemase